MEFKIEDFKLKPLVDGKFIKPSLATYKINGESRSWEVVKSYDSVAILIYNRDNNSFVCVKQFRPAVYAHLGDDGVTLELCAGLVDKNLTLEQIASEEVIEETGYKVDAKELIKIASFHTSVGFSGSKQHLYYVEVDNNRRVTQGGGVVGEEMIEVVEIPISSAREFIYNDNIVKTPGLMFAFEWFFKDK